MLVVQTPRVPVHPILHSAVNSVLSLGSFSICLTNETKCRLKGKKDGQTGGPQSWSLAPQKSQTAGSVLSPSPAAGGVAPRRQSSPDPTKGGECSLCWSLAPLFPWQPLFQDKARTQNYPHHVSRLLRRESPDLRGTLRQGLALSPRQTAVSSPSQDSSHRRVCLPATFRQ